MNLNATAAVTSHSHRHEAHSAKCKLTKTQSILFMLSLTAIFFFVELIVGHMTKSNALVADAFHMLSDIVSLVIGLVAVRMTRKKTSTRNTYGWVRAEVLGSLVNSVFLLALCFSIVIEAINRFVKPEELVKVDLMLIVGAIGLAVNLIGLVIFRASGHEHGHSHHGHSHSRDSHHEHETHDLQITVVDNAEGQQQQQQNDYKLKKEKKQKPARNMNMHGVFLHVLSDALGSVAVIISGLIVKFAPPQNNLTVRWKLYIDPTLSILITVLITISTVPLLKEASLVLLQTVPSQFNVEQLKKLIVKVPGVLNVHHFHLWSLNSEKLIASAHLKIEKQSKFEEFSLMQDVKKMLHSWGIHATTLQLEYDEYSIGETTSNRYDVCDGADCFKKQCCQDEQALLIQNEENEEKY